MADFAYWQGQMAEGTFLCMMCWRTCLIEEAYEDEDGKWDICSICGNGGDGNPELGKELR